MNYFKFNNDCDLSKPNEVLEYVKKYIDNEELCDEQKLFGIQCLLRESALQYIDFLKKKIEKMKKISDLDIINKKEHEIQALLESNKKIKEKNRSLGQQIHELTQSNGDFKRKNLALNERIGALQSELSKKNTKDEQPVKKRIIVVSKKKEE